MMSEQNETEKSKPVGNHCTQCNCRIYNAAERVRFRISVGFLPLFCFFFFLIELFVIFLLYFLFFISRGSPIFDMLFLAL